MASVIGDSKDTKEDKVALETLRTPTDFELEEAGETYADFYKWRDYRTGSMTQFNRYDFESVLRISRQLFWNALNTSSEDLNAIGINISLPYVRKEVLQFISKITAQDYKGRFNGDALDIFGVKVLQGIYDKWRFKQTDKVEKFWETLYGVVNGTVCNFIGYNDGKLTRRYLEGYNKKTGEFRITERKEKIWDDVWSEIVPIEDIYLPKIYERNIQKQGRLIWKTEMDWKTFKAEFHNYDNAEYVYPGNMIAEDSLYFRMLQGTGITAGDKVQILKKYDWISDKYVIYANSVLLNPIGKGEKQTSSPMPWKHKMAPFSWGIFSPLDEKLAWGLPLPFLLKEMHKSLNVSNTMLMEHELRNVSPPILSSDIDSPKIIYGKHDVIQVNDTNAYKELKLSEPSAPFFEMMNNLRQEMADVSQGGSTPPMPTRQPRSAQETLRLQAIQQQTMGITLLMYYNILRQQMLLVIKTALQFYPISKYKKSQGRILRAMNVPNVALTTGGIGTLHLRIVKKKQDDLISYLESIQLSAMNGRPTEIIEAPARVIQDLEFEITDIDMEPTQTDEMRKATFMEQVIQPMIQTYVPAGIADIGKVFLRHLEKLGEHPVDFASDKVLGQLMDTWKNDEQVKIPPAQPQQQQGQGGPSNQPPAPGTGQQTGNLNQSVRGTVFGSKNTKPIPTQ